MIFGRVKRKRTLNLVTVHKVCNLISFAVHIEDLKNLFGSLLTTRVPTLAGVGCRRSHHARLRLLEPFQKDF
jgi:hypothetical protein